MLCVTGPGRPPIVRRQRATLSTIRAAFWGLGLGLGIIAGCKGSSAPKDPAAMPEPSADDPNLCRAPVAAPVGFHGSPEWPTPACRERAAGLLAKMTLQEKAAQMLQVDCAQLENVAEMDYSGFGAVLCGGDSAPKDRTGAAWAEFVEDFHHRAARANHSIPLLFGIDAVHGHNAVLDAVIYPHNIGLGATRDPELLERIARVTAEDVRATGINWVFGPVLAAAQDERWGRTYESYSEDPTLVAQLGLAVVRGLQGEAFGQSPTSVLASAKHFIGDGHTAGGVDRGDALITDEYLRAQLLPVYAQAVTAGVGNVMASYSSVRGTKMHCNGPLLSDALKHELGFNGFVVSDWEAIEKIPGDYPQRLAQSINAGVDMVMRPAAYKEFVPTLVSLVPEQVSQARIDDAVQRILAVKCEMGLLAPVGEQNSPTLAQRDKLKLLRARQRLDLAREAVRKSVVVLKNADVLPLAKDASIHVAGRNADDIGNQCGGWTVGWQGQSGKVTEGTSILAGMRQVAGDVAKITYSRDGIGAPGASVGVVVVGETPYAEQEGDNGALALDPDDVAVVKAMRAARIPIVLVLVAGRPLVLGKLLDQVDAVVVAWLPGTEGAGVADVLFGDFAPTGKLSYTWPAAVEQIPINETQKGQALFPFGHGLTYARE